MVLEIKSIGCIEDLRKVPKFLGVEKDENWLNVVCYSLSTKCGTLAFAHQYKVIILSNQWDSTLQQYKYSCFFSGCLKKSPTPITSIHCLPITNEQKNTTTESTIIILGHYNGEVRFMNTKGVSIFTQQWHNETVQAILIQNEKKDTEEIYVIYQTCVCILQCKQLLRTIRSIDIIAYPDVALDSFRTITGRLWRYGEGNESDSVTNSSIIGSKTVCLFDHLAAASYEGGYFAKYRSSAPQQLVILAVGLNPFIGFYYAKEILIQPVLSMEIARVVANKVKNVLPSWLTGAQAVPPPNTIIPSISTEYMMLRYAFNDDHRATQRIWFAARNQLAAISDSLGRVLLVDCSRTVILRIWKGYRDAQCAFIQVDEKMSRNDNKTKRKRTLFLAIYSPRRSSVDIWNVERGKKLATYPAGPHGQLIQQTGIVPSNENSSHVKSFRATAAFYLNSTDLTIKELTIPFHYALDTSSTKRSKDMHVINQIKIAIKTDDENQIESNLEEISDLCDSIQTNEMRYKCINTLIKNRHLTPEILSIILQSFIRNILSAIDASPDMHRNTNLIKDEQLLEFLRNYEKLVNFYVNMKPLKQFVEKLSPSETEENSDVVIKPNFDEIFKVIETYRLCLNHKRSAKVKIQCSHQNNTFTEFLSIFDCTNGDGVQLNELKLNRFNAVAFDLFDTFIENIDDLNVFCEKVEKSSITSRDLSKLFLRYWMEKEIPFDKRDITEKHLTNFINIFNQICKLDPNNVHFKYTALSSWWQEIREILLESGSVFKASLAAMLCRDLSLNYRQLEYNENSGEDEPWEEVSQEAAQWSLLIGKLDDIAVLSSILTVKPVSNISNEPNEYLLLPYTIPDISLISILEGGKGIISELVAKWMASTPIRASAFFESSDVLTPAICFKTLQKHFPFSLNEDIVLTHVAWEYACAWNDNIQHLEYLNMILQCLNAFREPESILLHGICCRIWNRFVRQAIITVMKVLNRSDDGNDEFSDTIIPEFVSLCDKFIALLVQSKNRKEIVMKFEELLQDGKVPLIVTVTQEDVANSDMILLHMQLNQIMLLLASLNVNFKYTIHDMFNETTQHLFGQEINARFVVENPRPDEGVNKNRRHFIRRLINAAIDLIRFDFEETYVKDYDFWMDRIMSLATTWGLNTEELTKHEIIQLYTRGWDDVAEGKLENFARPSSLGKTLLLITATRLNYYVKDKPEIYSRIVTMGSLISGCLETLENTDIELAQNEIDSNVFVDRLLKIARRTYKCLSENQTEGQDLRLAGQLYDACAEIRNYFNSNE